MTKRKSTKSALITSVLALFLCFAMLLGSTFAWFTDSAASANNIIKSGNLDMKLSFKEYGAENTEWTEVKEDTVVFGKDALYEPGYTEAVWLKVENLGSLAFRYNLAINVLNEKEGVNRDGKSFKLSDYLEVKYMVTTSTEMEENYYTTSDRLHGFNFGGVANSGVASLKEDIAMINNGVAFSKDDAAMGDYSSSYVLVIISMPETVGNEACHDGKTIPEITFSLTAMATQLSHEEDSFGSGYDAKADYDNPEDLGYEVVYIYDLEDFTEFGNAINSNAAYGGVKVANNSKVWVELMADIDMTNAPGIQGGQFAIGNGNNLQFHGVFDGNNHVISNYTIKGSWTYNVSLFRTVSGNFTMKDITFDNCYAEKPNNRVSSILVGTIGGGTITFDNVDIKNSEVKGVAGTAAYVGNMTEGALYFIDCDVENVTLTTTSATGMNGMFLRDGYSHHDYEASGVWVTNCTMNGCKSSLDGAQQSTIAEYNYTK